MVDVGDYDQIVVCCPLLQRSNERGLGLTQ
jgi:hypothetical protein